MSNSSLFAAFERMWQNMLSKLNDYSNEIDGVISQNAADIATIKEDLDAFFADVSEQSNKASLELESVRAENQELRNQLAVVKAENTELANQLSAAKILLGVD